MQVLQKRHIKPGHEYDKLFPKSSRQDTVIQGVGKARLHHTINLIKDLVWETREDTKLLAGMLNGENLEETCRNIWKFVYGHINYRRDKAGVEQVRRPSRTWADRKKGVDCDCYTVFISSLLTNLDIPHRVRITKYGGKRHFQHIYPVVPTEACATAKATGGTRLAKVGCVTHGKYITIDCVTDHFDYEVPFSDYRDFSIENRKPVSEIHGLPLTTVSGVDSADLAEEDLGIFSLKQPKLPLREIVKSELKDKSSDSPTRLTIKPVSKEKEAPKAPRLFVSRIAETVEPSNEINPPECPEILPERDEQTRQGRSGFWIKLLLAAGVGYGTFKLLEFGT